ncbi:hypothetical protein FJ872_16985 [Mesorhizobium sp. B2-5-9]|uniref:hypothetical protein n=1 Tax=unclassified Mesorhizobium TaxID=325217 RepID=UPI00112EC7A3|nr:MULTISPECIES: hypothetical protein [unclassified Mesorhizobium]TPK18477.1 hypothetical protein FJ872_16985 [Mesorhizobium sp. B2-5-9]TPK74991.1 hypothetical protein FJ527_17890 [Mesorhizobium sp. B2-4-18]TPK81839.1 hypothetical protein FJ936_25485 [Mesorhizobium sp. B2-4-13]
MARFFILNQHIGSIQADFAGSRDLFSGAIKSLMSRNRAEYPCEIIGVGRPWALSEMKSDSEGVKSSGCNEIAAQIRWDCRHKRLAVNTLPVSLC